ncbi:unnamed protein product [Cylindrotheca closterium]|uniref:Uncharacterized protein n=1 Tax=Cylindrotheca closterium TaxID=2856 RepID=A0AAD2CNW3_9STRA|nr:unnamed protein product [Cylindrotheca closterium]
MIRYTTVSEKKEQHFNKLYVLDHDVLENGSDPLAFSWPAKTFSKTDPVKVPKLEAWLINEELEQDQSKVFVMEDITDKDPETAYDLLVTRKRMPIPKDFLDITWDGTLAREVLRLVIDRIKMLTNSEEPKKFRKRDQLSKNVREPAVLTATSARCWVSGVISLDFAGLDSEDSDSPDKTYELLTKTLVAVEESKKATKTSVESLSEVVVAGIHGQASDKAPPNTVEKKWSTRLSYLTLVELELCLRGNVEKGLNVFNSVCFQHYKNGNAINDYNKSDYWLTGKKTAASMKDHQAHDKIKHAIPKGSHANVDSIAQKLGVSLQERALERFLFGIYSQIDRYFEPLVRSSTNAEENLPDLGTYVETCYHGGSPPESNLFGVAWNRRQDGESTEERKERAQKKSLGESVKNSDMNEEHHYTGRTKTELIKRTGKQPPKHADGKELCLIWHTKGECKENCEHDAAPDIVHSEPWIQSQLDMQVAWGCHASANEFKKFLMEEFLDFGRKGFWILLPYDAIKDEKGLCPFPIGCVPQDNRRPRMIVDYSFWGLNDETMKLAPEGAMQFGKAQLRIREALMKANPEYGPVYRYKNDMSDGFYRI